MSSPTDYAPKHNPDAEVIEPPAWMLRQDRRRPLAGDMGKVPMPEPGSFQGLADYIDEGTREVSGPPPRAARSGHPDFDALGKVIEDAVASIKAEHPVTDPLDELAEDFTRIPILRAIELAKGIVEVMGGDTKPDSVELAVAMAKWGEQRKHPKVAA